MSIIKVVLILVFSVSFIEIDCIDLSILPNFLNDFVLHQERPSNIVSFINHTSCNFIDTCKHLSNAGLKYAQRKDVINNFRVDDYNIYVLEIANINFRDILYQAEKLRNLYTPSRWIFIYEDQNCSDAIIGNLENHKRKVEEQIKNIAIGINTEIYLLFDSCQEFHLYLIYKRRVQLPVIWEHYGIWNLHNKFDRPHPKTSLAMRRKNLEGLSIVTTAVFADRQSLIDSSDYMQRHIDSPSKIMYYMSIHLFEWMNATGHFNMTDTWGYKQPDGTYLGIMRELQEGRSEFAGSVLIVTADRMQILEYVISPAIFDIAFIFRKPALATTSNIYVMPFTGAVWLAIFILIITLSIAMLASSKENIKIGRPKVSILEKIADGLQDVLYCVFQQGTPQDPVTVAGRQILFLGLMAFLFLYTAYAANVVALLQSSDNNINSVDSLLNSPLQCGAHNVVYSRFIFKSGKRPAQRALWLKKGLPLGENFFMSTEEGIRRVKQERFAFHVDPIAGYDAIQKTFLEHEKCNIGLVSFVDLKYPYLGVAKYSHIKEALRIGAIRIKEHGVQERSNRRVISRKPSCGAGTGMFTAVDLLDVAPAFQCLLSIYALALIMLVVEVILDRHRKKNRR